MAAEGFPDPHPRPVGAAPERPDGAPPGGARPGWRPWSGILALHHGAGRVARSRSSAGSSSGWSARSSARASPTRRRAVNIAATVLQDVAFVGAALVFARRAGPLRAGAVRPAHDPPVAGGRLGRAGLAMVAFYASSAAVVGRG